MTTLVLLRHGETEWSKSGQHTGLTDLPLLPEGEEAARRVATLLSGWTFARVLVSPLQRARRTAELAGLTAVGGVPSPAAVQAARDHRERLWRIVRAHHVEGRALAAELVLTIAAVATASEGTWVRADAVDEWMAAQPDGRPGIGAALLTGILQQLRLVQATKHADSWWVRLSALGRAVATGGKLSDADAPARLIATLTTGFAVASMAWTPSVGSAA